MGTLNVANEGTNIEMHFKQYCCQIVQSYSWTIVSSMTPYMHKTMQVIGLTFISSCTYKCLQCNNHHLGCLNLIFKIWYTLITIYGLFLFTTVSRTVTKRNHRQSRYAISIKAKVHAMRLSKTVNKQMNTSFSIDLQRCVTSLQEERQQLYQQSS